MNLKAPTISIRDNRDNQVGVLYDYFNDSIELFLEGKVSILTLSVLDENNYRELLVNGNSLSFTYKSEDYHMIIVKSDEDEDIITITAWSLVLELNNETKAPFSGTSLTFAQYLNAFDGEKILTLNINEVSDKKISHTFDSQQTMLERLFSLAKLFNAEIEFKTILADDGSLERLEINVYRANDSKNQGIGENKSSEVFYFGEEITTVKKSSDIMNLFTAIRPVGKDGLNLNNYTMNDVKGEDGETLFYLKNGMIYAPRARELYPSNLINKADRWTVYDWATEYESQATLCGNALAKLRDELSTPAVTWTIEGYIDANIGDTISVHDNGYKPTLLLEARINSQRISMTDPSSNETTFSNVKEVQSEISAELIAKMNDIIKEKIQYTTSIITTNGTSFKNGKGSTVLKARVLSNNADITDKVSISWYKDDSFVKSSTELTVSASDIVEKAVYRFEVIDTYGNVKNIQEVTIFNVDDGSNGLGIKNITNKYAVSKSNVTPPTSWVDTPPRITEETKYLWNYDIITYTDNTTSETSKRVIGVYGDKGLDGLAGKDGLGVKTTTITYAISTSPTDTPSSGWTNQVPTLEKGKYLWTKTQWTYTDNTVENGYTVSYIAKDGNDGNDGVAGKDGVGISDTLIQYTGSTNGTTKPTTGWSSSIPAVAEGNYLWTKTTWTYTDGTKEDGYSVAKMGAKGADGKDGIAGKDGVGLKETVIRYASSTSGTTAPTTGWQSLVPTVTPGNFLWTRTVWTYTDNSSEIGYSVARIGADGNDGKDGIAGKDGVGLKSTTVTYAGSANGVTAPTNGWTLSIPSVADGNFLWTKTTWTYTDNTSEIGYSVARMGTKGSDGIAGKDGIGIKSTSIIYAGSTNGTVAPTTGWSTSIPAVPAGNYLWTKTTWAYTDGTSESGFTVSRIGKDGNTGKDGIAGKDGVGLKETSIQYAGSTSGTTPPTTGWTASVPTVASGSYLWTKTTWSYTDDTNETGYSVSKMGEPGAKGNTGDSATSYWVTPSVNAIQISTTKVLNPTTVTFTGYSKTGTANAGLYAGRFNILTSVDGIVYSSKYSSSANQSAYTYTVPADVKFIKARMYQSGGTSVLVDEVTIPIIESAEGLEIGGRNYFKGSEKEITASREFVNNPNWDMAPIFDTYGIDKFYTISFDLKSKVAGNIQIYAQNGSGSKYNIGTTNVQATTAYQRFSITVKPTLQASSTETKALLAFYGVYDSGRIPTVKNVMIETGTKASDWKPALEDAVTYQRWSNDPNGLVDMTDTYPNENLLLGTSNEVQSASGTGWFDGTRATNATQTPPKLEFSTNYTYSAYLTAPSDVDVHIYVRLSRPGAPNGSWEDKVSNIIPAGKSGLAKVTFSIPTDTTTISFTVLRFASRQTSTKTIQWSREKLELGSNATTWTSNQQDDKLLSIPQYIGVGVQNTMNPSDFTWTINPEYTQALADLGLEDKVDNGSYENDKSDIWEEIGNRVTGEEAQEIRDMAEALKNSYEAFISEGGQYQSDLEALDARSALLVQNLGDKLATYNFLDTHIKLGEEGLLIGAKGDPMKMLLSKDKLSFTDGGEVVAYFSKQSFYINRGAIVDSLQVGQHKMVKLNANHTIFQWITG